MMSNDSTKNDEESLFLSEMVDVTPLKPVNKIRHRKKASPSSGRSATETDNHSINDIFSTAEIPDDCPDVLSFSRGGLQFNALKKLRQGKNTVEAALDLHGMTVEQARKKLLQFLAECEEQGIRHIIIIHGKGFRSASKPVIKPMVNRWLRTTEQVLAFHTAQPKDGGSGAVYVLLKK